MWYCQKRQTNRPVEQREPETDPCTYGHMIYDRCGTS